MKATFITTLSIILFATVQLKAQDDGEYHLDRVYQMDSEGTLYLRSEDANVRITGSDRSDVRVVIDRIEDIKGISNRRRDFDMEIEEVSGDLYVTEKNRSSSRVTFGISVYRLEYDISIELPRNASLKIDGEDDDYVIRSVNGSISIDVEDGDIELLNCESKDFEITLEDGDLKLDGGYGELYVDVEDGDLDIRNGQFEGVEITTEDGDLMIETTLADGGFYDIDGEDATIEFVVLGGSGQFDISRDDARVNASDAFKLIRDTERRITYELGSEGAEVSIRTKDGRVRLFKN